MEPNPELLAKVCENSAELCRFNLSNTPSLVEQVAWAIQQPETLLLDLAFGIG